MVFDATLQPTRPKRKCIRFGFYFFTVLCVSIHLSFSKEAYSKCETFFTPKLITTFLDFQVCMHFKMFTKCKVLHPMLCSQSVSVPFVMYAHLSMCKYYRNDGDGGGGGKYLSFAYRYQKKYHMEFNINSLWTIQIKEKTNLRRKSINTFYHA